MDKLIQSGKLVTREFRIENSTIYYKYSKFGNSNEVAIPFENLSGEKVANSTTNNNWLIGGIGTILIGILLIIGRITGSEIGDYAELFWLIIGFVCLIFYYFSKEEFWSIRLTNDSYLSFHQSIPNTEIVTRYLEELMRKRNDYLLANYGLLDQKLDYRIQFDNLKWLQKMNVISQDEFNQKYSELNRLFNKDNRKIGF